MQTIVRRDQSLFDIALQEYGKAEAAFDIAQANSLNVNADLVSGQVLIIPVVSDEDAEVVDFFLDEKLVIATDKIRDDELQGLALMATIINIVNEINGGDGRISISVVGGTLPYVFSWKDALGIEVGTAQNLNNVAAGEYEVTVTDDDGVSKMLTAIVIAIGQGGNQIVDHTGDPILTNANEPLEYR